MHSVVKCENVDLDGFCLLLPSVSVGNIGQLAIDLLIYNTTSCRYLGRIDHPSLSPVIGWSPNADDDGSSEHLMTPAEMFISEKNHLLIIQLHSQLLPRGRLSLLSDLLSWCVERGVTRVLQLASCHASTRTDPSSRQLRAVTAAGGLVPPGCVTVQQVNDLVTDCKVVPGSGFVADLQSLCEKRSLPFTCVMSSVYEGNNIPEAVVLANYAVSHLDIDLQKSSHCGLGKFQLPPTWKHLEGPSFDKALFG